MAAFDNEKLENQVLKTANRLRLVQVDFADQPEQTRNEYLCEEIERALKTVVPDRRNRFLEALMARFPLPTLGSQPMQKVSASADASVAVHRLKDADFLIRSLLPLVPTLSEDQKKLIADSLHLRQETPLAEGGYSQESVKKLKAVLLTGDGSSIRADRLMDLSIMLADFVCKLEPLVWNIWRKLSPRSGIRPSASLKDIMGKFVFNAQGASAEQIDNELKELQRLIAAIITAIGRVGGQFAKSHLAKFSPSEISAMVKVEHGSVFVSQEVRCWRKYAELASTLNEDTIESEIRDVIVGYVESLRKGIGR